jgi:hypothetical protein
MHSLFSLLHQGLFLQCQMLIIHNFFPRTCLAKAFGDSGYFLKVSVNIISPILFKLNEKKTRKERRPEWRRLNKTTDPH